MCGIAGFVNREWNSETARHDLAVMLNSLSHRGPDDQGIWLDNPSGVALGHRRLALVDLTFSGHQPMLDSSERFVIVFNGEIYNHQDIRMDLEASVSSINWRGHSDTEVFLESIAAWGLERALQRCVGMFAFALWECESRTLTLARDRMGEKPLYYCWQGAAFLFASELKALRSHTGFRPAVDKNVLPDFLHYGYIQGPSTIYQGVHKLNPGCMLVLTHREITARALPEPIAYWSLAEVAAKEKSRQFSGSYSDAICQLEFLLNRAVGIQATADVAVGAFLSGGIDSSAVVAMMCKLHRGPVHTFSIGMPLAGFDEGKYAAEVASYLGIEHISHTIEASEALDLLPRLPEIWDEPFADSSQIPTLLLCQLASQSVTVALTGDGGDELFLGYNQYPIMHKLWSSRLLRHLPWQTALGFFSSFRVPRAHRRLMLARNVVEAWHQSDPAALNSYWMDRFRHQSNPLFKNNLKPRRSMGIKYTPAEAFALEDAAAYLPDDILVKVDRASMACSLETRAPFLDHRIVEFALSLPLAFKLQGATGKVVLRDMLYKHVPRKLVDRPKMGFSIPLGNWLRIELRPWVESLLADIPPGSDFIRKDVVNVIWQEHVSGYADRSDQLWPILMLLSWSNLNKVVL